MLCQPLPTIANPPRATLGLVLRISVIVLLCSGLAMSPIAEAQPSAGQEKPPAEPISAHESPEQGAPIILDWELEAGGRVGSDVGLIGAGGLWVKRGGRFKPGLFLTYSLTDWDETAGFEPRMRYRLTPGSDAEIALGIHAANDKQDSIYSASLGVNLAEIVTLRFTSQVLRNSVGFGFDDRRYKFFVDASLTGTSGTYASIVEAGGGALLVLILFASQGDRHK